jgi:iron complex outermembrane recepter protein
MFAPMTLLGIGLCGVAAAQTTPEPAAAGPETSASTSAVEPLQEIEVTGTRIHRDGFQAPVSTTVMDSQQLQLLAPSNIADALNNLPQLAVGSNPRIGNDGTSGGTSGLNTLNLLNLGAERTLVLLDGQRIAGANPTGVVDINTIPQQLVERVDVVTGGGSADYGSDAVAGVVNFILNKKFTGFVYNLQYGETSQWDGQNYKFEMSYGTPFADGRGHFIVSGSFSDVDGITTTSSRSWFNGSNLVANTPGSTPGLVLASNVNMNTATAGGLVVNNPANGTLVGTQFGPGGVPSQFQFGTPTGTANSMFGGQYNTLAASVPISSGLDTRDVFTRGSFDFTPNVTGYGEFSYGKSEVTDPAVYQFELGSVSIAQNNPYLPGSVSSAMAAQGLTHLVIGTWNQDIGQLQVRNNSDSYRAVAGIDAKLPGTWSLKAYYQYGETDAYNAVDNELNTARYTQAISAVRDPVTGNIVCSNPANGCVPLNVLGTGVASAAAMAWVTGTASRNQVMEQHVASVTVEGEPLSTWAGPVSVAFGGEYRKESASGDVDPISLASGWFSGNFKAVAGSYDVKEAFLETVIPLAENLPFAKSIDFNGAVRATDYSTTGYVTTWKLGALWKPIDDFLVRANLSRDIRAPNLSDLFAQSQFTQTVTDPTKGGQSDTITAYLSSGNPNLQPEKAANHSLGIVYSPSYFRGFTASVDYYETTIDGFITSLAGSAQQAVNLCYQGVSAVCPLITRDAAGDITTVRLAGVNSGLLRTSGLNIETAYNTDLSNLSPWLGTLTVRALANHLYTYYLNTGVSSYNYAGEVSGQNVVATGGTYFPNWRTSLTAIYEKNAFSLGLVERFISKGVIENGLTPAQISNNDVPAMFYTDASLAYKTRFGPEVYFAVDNLFDKQPPTVAPLSSLAFLNVGTSAGLYDTVGRDLRIGIRGKF